MYRIIEGRGTGKTYRLLQAAKESHGTVVCYNPRAMEEKAKAYGIIGVNFVSYSDFLNSPGQEYGAYYIDELEVFSRVATMKALAMGNFSGYTLSLE